MDMQWNWNNMQSANTQTAADVEQRAALENELRQNDARIAELKAQLQQNRVNADELDRKLAANRAGIGDTSTALAHQRAIDDRAQRAAMNAYAEGTRRTERESLREGQKKKLIADIEDIDLQLNSSYADPKVEPDLLARRKRLVEELRSLGGDYADYKKGDESLAYWAKFKEEHTDKNGRWDSEDNRAKYESQNTSTIEGVKNVKNAGKTQDEVNEAARKEKEEANAAIDEVAGMVSDYALQRAGGTITREASNGKTVTVTKTANGKRRFKCGKESRVE